MYKNACRLYMYINNTPEQNQSQTIYMQKIRAESHNNNNNHHIRHQPTMYVHVGPSRGSSGAKATAKER